MMNVNPIQLMNLFRNNGNPKAVLMNMMRQNAGQNPLANNALTMMEKGDNAGIEQMVRNLCKTKGLDPDEVLKQVKNQFGAMK